VRSAPALPIVQTHSDGTRSFIFGHSQLEHPVSKPVSDGDGTAATAVQQSSGK
jgi:hypothetical protein